MNCDKCRGSGLAKYFPRPPFGRYSEGVERICRACSGTGQVGPDGKAVAVRMIRRALESWLDGYNTALRDMEVIHRQRVMQVWLDGYREGRDDYD
jgi:ribosome modulation factor